MDRFHACRIKTLATPAVVVVEVQQECLALFSGWVDDFAAEALRRGVAEQLADLPKTLLGGGILGDAT